MKKLLIIVAVIVIAALAVVYLGKSYMSTTNSGSNSNTPSQAVTPDNVVIQNFAFNPETLTVKVGTTVTWTNNDSTTHSIKSSTFNSSGLSTNDTFKFTFNTPGTFNYNCGIHPTMTGTIIVQ